MRVTVDASVAAAWLLPDEARPAADALIAQTLAGEVALQAPGLWAWETGNLLRMATLRKRITRQHWRGAWNALSLAKVALEPVPEAERRQVTLDLATDTGLTFYDAAYLEQAQRTGASLATLDSALQRAAHKLGVPCLTL